MTAVEKEIPYTFWVLFQAAAWGIISYANQLIVFSPCYSYNSFSMSFYWTDINFYLCLIHHANIRLWTDKTLRTQVLCAFAQTEPHFCNDSTPDIPNLSYNPSWGSYLKCLSLCAKITRCLSHRLREVQYFLILTQLAFYLLILDSHISGDCLTLLCLYSTRSVVQVLIDSDKNLYFGIQIWFLKTQETKRERNQFF